jgi:alkylation response protein AidB-like acyl-CoA dehydrogenase
VCSNLKNLTISTRYFFNHPSWHRSHFLQLIVNFEIARCGARGYIDGILAGGVIGLPPVLNFGSPELQAQVVPDVLSGKKFICLAVSEPFAGSDVSGLQTTAVQEGNEWVISGTKKCVNIRASRIVLTGVQMDNERNVC